MDKYGPVTDANALAPSDIFDRAISRICGMYRESGITKNLIDTFATYEAMFNRASAIAAEKAATA